MAKSTHYFRFLYQRFLTSTQGWKDDAIGAYLKLLIYQFDNDGLPNDFKFLCGLTSSLKKNKELIMPKFHECEDGKLRNNVMQQERERVKNTSESNSNNVKNRWKNDTNVSENAYENDTNVLRTKYHTNKPVNQYNTVVAETASPQQQNDSFLFQLFKNCSDWKTELILQEVGKFKNKYPDLPLNKSGPVVNKWVANYIPIKPKTVQKETPRYNFSKNGIPGRK